MVRLGMRDREKRGGVGETGEEATGEHRSLE